MGTRACCNCICIAQTYFALARVHHMYVQVVFVRVRTRVCVVCARAHAHSTPRTDIMCVTMPASLLFLSSQSRHRHASKSLQHKLGPLYFKLPGEAETALQRG
jgi:hypothetical protein